MAGEIADNRGRGGTPWSLPSIHPEGRRLGLAAVAVGLVALLLGWEWLGVPALLASLALFAIFRDPERVIPQHDRAILAPVDGTVTQIVTETAPEELRIDDGSGNLGMEDTPRIRVSVYCSLFDSHINRVPISGTIRRIVYMPGEFGSAELDRASEVNERQYYLIERSDGLQVGLTQIAGTLARRLYAFVKGGDSVGAGQRIGMIPFGSRVDVWLPPETEAKVLLGQRCVAGETIIATAGEQSMIEGVRQ